MDSISDKNFVIYWFIVFTLFFLIYIYVYKKIIRDKDQSGLNIQIVGFCIAIFGFLLGYIFDYVYAATKIGGLGALIASYGIFKRILNNNK